jgi:endo-alpha-1,4-polygalactosaminidase (GH114 family)
MSSEADRDRAPGFFRTGLLVLAFAASAAPGEAQVFVDGFESATPTRWSSSEGWIWQPSPGVRWQWQLTGTIDTTVDVLMYDLDLFDVPQSVIDALHDDGRVVVCYLSAGSWESWRPDQGDFPPEVLGNELDGWPGERWLDVRRLDVLGPIMEARLDLASAKSCDGVEPDNVDGYANDTGFPLTSGDQLAYNLWLASQAHERDLSVGLKNDLAQIDSLLPHFDWALNEECFFYDECSLLDPFVAAGKAVFGVEYVGDPSHFCPAVNARGFSWMMKNWDLDAWRIDCQDLP